MGQEYRVSKQLRAIKLLRVIFLGLCIAFLISYTKLPKSDCEVCSFDYNGGIDYKTFSNYFVDTCLSEDYYDIYTDKEPVYIPIDELNYTLLNDG